MNEEDDIEAEWLARMEWAGGGHGNFDRPFIDFDDEDDDDDDE